MDWLYRLSHLVPASHEEDLGLVKDIMKGIISSPPEEGAPAERPEALKAALAAPLEASSAVDALPATSSEDAAGSGGASAKSHTVPVDSPSSVHLASAEPSTAADSASSAAEEKSLGSSIAAAYSAIDSLTRPAPAPPPQQPPRASPAAPTSAAPGARASLPSDGLSSAQGGQSTTASVGTEAFPPATGWTPPD
ncbi:unnamed protein product, partial [Polarella glacialis]